MKLSCRMGIHKMVERKRHTEKKEQWHSIDNPDMIYERYIDIVIYECAKPDCTEKRAYKIVWDNKSGRINIHDETEIHLDLAEELCFLESV